MRVTKLRLEEDVAFIFAEAARFQKILEDWAQSRKSLDEHKESFLYQIDFPDGRKLTVGRAAMARLEGLATLAGRNAGIGRQVDLLTIRKPLGKSLVRRFVVEARPISFQHVERAMSEAARYALKQRRTVTHYLPCHLMLGTEPARFSMGSISFLRQSEFRSVLAKQIRAKRKELRSEKRIIRDAAQYYSTFSWVAEITIPNCDEETSKIVAKRAVTAALNCLHLLFGPGHTQKMSVGGPAISFDRRGGFEIENGNLNVMASYGGPGTVGFDDDWIKFFDREEASDLLGLCGVALEAAISPNADRALSDRFLEAASWFGEAVRETSPAAKVIKYVTALERMFMTDENGDISSTVSQRVATFCYGSKPDDFVYWYEKAKRAYTLRSKLAHGSMSPHDDAVFEGVNLGAEVGRFALLSGLKAFGEKGLREEGVSVTRVAEWFRLCVKDVHEARLRLKGADHE